MLLRIGIALIAVGAIAGIATALFWDGPDRDRTIEYRVVSEDGTPAEGDPNVVLVREDGWDGPRFFPVFPLVVVGGVLVTLALFARGRGGWGGPRNRFEDWHREAHRDDGGVAPPAAS